MKITGFLSVLSLLVYTISFGQNVISPKGTRITLDTSKWKAVNNDINLKNVGNVGIGIAPPLYKLDISAPSNPIRLTGLQTGASTDSVITESAGVLRRVSLSRLATDTSIYKLDGTLSGNRTLTMNANNLTLNATTGNLIYNPANIGHVGIGTASPNASALVHMSSSNQGILVPRMHTTNRNAVPKVDGLLVYDTSTHSFWVSKVSAIGINDWVQLISGIPTVVNRLSSYTLTQDDNGNVIEFNGAGPFTLTVPSSLSIGFQCSVTQLGTGVVTVLAGDANITIRNTYNYTRTAGQYSKIGIEIPRTSPKIAILSGDAQ